MATAPDDSRASGADGLTEPGLQANWRISGKFGRCSKQAGTPPGDCDLLIGAHARSLGIALVTDNRREFDRMPGLSVGEPGLTPTLMGNKILSSIRQLCAKARFRAD